MKMISLPSGKFINPAHVESIDVHAHFWVSKKFYVQMSLKNGSTEDIAERLDHDKAGSAVWDQRVEREIDASDFGEEGGDAGFDRGGVELGPRIGHIIIRIAANENHRPVLRHYYSLQGEYFRPGEILRTVLGEFAQAGLGISARIDDGTSRFES